MGNMATKHNRIGMLIYAWRKRVAYRRAKSLLGHMSAWDRLRA